MKKSIMLAVVLAFSASSWAQCQGPEGNLREGKNRREMGRMEHRGGLKDHFFPPELIMRNQESLGLTDEQKASICEIMKKSVSDFTDLQWQESGEQEKMSSLLKEDRIDEGETLDQLDKLLGIENQMKKLHMGTMIRVLNILSPEQKSKLNELKNSMGARPGENDRHRQGCKEDREGNNSSPCPSGK